MWPGGTTSGARGPPIHFSATKSHDDALTLIRSPPVRRPPNTEIGERECVNAHKCIAKWLAVFRYGEETKKQFVCKEFLLPSQHKEFMQTGELPKTPAKCLLCSRYFTVRSRTCGRTAAAAS